MAPDAFRGEVWDVDVGESGEHPAVVIRINVPQPVDTLGLLRQRGRLAQAELRRIEAALRVYLGL